MTMPEQIEVHISADYAPNGESVVGLWVDSWPEKTTFLPAVLIDADLNDMFEVTDKQDVIIRARNGIAVYHLDDLHDDVWEAHRVYAEWRMPLE